MPSDYHPYSFLAVFLVVAVLFPLVPIGLAYLWARTFSPQKPGPDKNAIYECGLESRATLGSVQIRCYLYAIVF